MCYFLNVGRYIVVLVVSTHFKKIKKVKSIALLFTFYLYNVLFFLACSGFIASSSINEDLATIV